MYQKEFLVLVFSTLLSCSGYTQFPHPKAHAHNDYEHDRPLYDALANGFSSVEADVHLIDGKLYVSHDPPKDLSTTPLLEDLYLLPLLKRASENRGNIYPDYDGPFYLMVDFKTKAEDTYRALHEILKKYASILTTVNQKNENEKKPVTVFISGNRPIRQVMEAEIKYAGLDGRPADLEENYPLAVMPVVSDNYRNFLSWKGEGAVDKKELEKLESFIELAHQQGKKVRLWATPDTPEAWNFLLTLGVDLINTDRLEDFNQYMAQRKSDR